MSVSLFLFFKQKTAYDLRISDWSSDVCSSDLDRSGSARFPGASPVRPAPPRIAARRITLMTDDDTPHGLGRGLTNYGDNEFSLYLRRSMASSMGYSRDMLSKPVVGICSSGSGYNNCHRLMPELDRKSTRLNSSH